jgi:hypothetical protein
LADQADNTLDILESRIDRHLGPVVDAAGEFARQFADGRLNLEVSRTNTFHAFSGALSSNSQMTAILFIRADGKSITFTRLEGYPLEVQPTQQILERRITGFPYWYHRIKLTDGVITPGWAPIDAASYRIPDDLTGTCVLDIGAWDGYWSSRLMISPTMLAISKPKTERHGRHSISAAKRSAMTRTGANAIN